jgi:hypothetical protein
VSQADLDLVRRAIDWFTIDEPLPLDIFAADYMWRPSVTGGDLSRGGTFVGTAGWEEYRRVAGETWASLSIDSGAMTDMGRGVIYVEHTLQAVGKTSNAQVAMPAYSVGVVRDGRVAASYVFQTADEARRYAEELLGRD